MSKQRFRIDVPATALEDLNRRLDTTRWPDEVANENWDYGTNLAYLQDLCRYWQSGFKWRDHERALNRLSHWRVETGGLGIHYIHERAVGSEARKGFPILLLHGWPDSFFRYVKVIPLLTQAGFDVVVPSLPGFGFSDRPQRTGGADVAEILADLMSSVLGYDRFAIHGGDTGSVLAREIAGRFADQVTAIHLTDIGYDAASIVETESLTDTETEYFRKVDDWMFREGGYIMIQGTKPQTLSYGLSDSPAGLAAWIVEKFHRWSDCDGELGNCFTHDELLTNIAIYWFTGTIASSIRLYYDGMNQDWTNISQVPRIQVPVGVSLFPKDGPGIPPRTLAERLMPITYWQEMDSGGHFAALEKPKVLGDEIIRFLGLIA